MTRKSPLEVKYPDKIFGKYSLDVEVKDPGLVKYISLRPMYFPNSFGRHAKKHFAKSRVNIVERLINSLMRGGTGDKISGKVIRTHGRLQGKKTKTTSLVKKAFEYIEQTEKNNPVQYLVKAIENSAPREDFTRVSYGGVTYQVAVDISPQRRVDLALRNIAHAAITKSFNTGAKLYKTLAEEIIYAAKNDNVKSYAVKKKNEIERMARAAR